MYLEGIHAGIQTAHVQSAIESKYRLLTKDELDVMGERFFETETKNLRILRKYQDWADRYKVIQVYNGGYSSSLRQRFSTLGTYAAYFELPFASFNEGEDALDGALTSVGIIVPENLYDRDNRDADPQSPEGSFYRFLHECKHAR